MLVLEILRGRQLLTVATNDKQYINQSYTKQPLAWGCFVLLYPFDTSKYFSKVTLEFKTRE